jgi:Tetrahydrodipicolinate N-succinyltransferase
MSDLERIINDAFEERDNINVNTAGDIRNAVDETLNKLDSGSLRVCEKINNEWQVNQWIKKAIFSSDKD